MNKPPDSDSQLFALVLKHIKTILNSDLLTKLSIWKRTSKILVPNTHFKNVLLKITNFFFAVIRCWKEELP